MNLLSLFAFAVYAASSVISPIPDDVAVVIPMAPKPSVSFGEITAVFPTPTPAPESVPAGKVLGETTEITPTLTPPQVRTKKQSYTIALLGDSMVDTLGPGVPALKTSLQHAYPQTSFTILNYGVGATNIDYGIERVTNGYTYLGNQMPSLSSTQPDIVVLESFGYNPFPVAIGGVDRHWLALARAVDTIRASIPGAKIIIGATIAPNSKTFGDGAPGVAFAPQDKIERTTVIKEYLESTVKFASSQRLPLADAYHASLDAQGDGILKYINGGDHIHYSDAGRALFAQKIAGAIAANRLLE